MLVQGELWRAVAQGEPVEPGEAVRVLSVNGLTLNVVKHRDGGGAG